MRVCGKSGHPVAAHAAQQNSCHPMDSPQARARYEPAAPPCWATRTAKGLCTIGSKSGGMVGMVGVCGAARHQPCMQHACPNSHHQSGLPAS